MPDLDILRRMIQDAAQIPLAEDDYSNPIVTLEEPQCPDSFVTIRRMPEDAVVISVDDFWSLEGMFTHEKGQCKRADFVIIADTGTQKVIVYIEMKRTHESSTTVIQQLTGARCFIAYCREIGQASAFWNQRDFLSEYEERFVYIGHTNTSINKRPTRTPPETGVHDRPEAMLKLTAQHHLTLKRLIGKNR